MAAWDTLRATMAFWAGHPVAIPSSHPLQVRSRRYASPILIRPATSDILAFDQVIVREEYKPLTLADDVRVIIDCGANIGCTSVYLLNCFPNALVVAIEPDPGNAELCHRNLAPFGARAAVVQAGVWSRETGLRIERGRYRDGREWSFRVRECLPEESPDVQAVSLPAILQRFNLATVDILKVDVEGSELELFANECDTWLNRVQVMAIEVHDDHCRQTVLSALGRHPFDLRHQGETLFAFRRHPRSPL